MDETDKKVNDLLALLCGEPGPFLEDEKHFFGRKRVDPSMKDKKMETDCGGMIITKSSLTYGQADNIAASIDLSEVMNYIRNDQDFPEGYWKAEGGKVFYGELLWAIYSYLACNRIIEGKWDSYQNSSEYLFDQILKRMEEANLVKADSERRYFTYDGL